MILFLTLLLLNVTLVVPCYSRDFTLFTRLVSGFGPFPRVRSKGSQVIIFLQFPRANGGQDKVLFEYVLLKGINDR